MARRTGTRPFLGTARSQPRPSAHLVDHVSRIFRAASVLAIGATALVAAIVSVPVLAGDAAVVVADVPSSPVEPALSAGPEVPAPTANNPAPLTVPHPNLTSLVGAMAHQDPEDSELHCLATGIYFESRGEPLEGQLAVAQVILNRATSGRFAPTLCGVLTQRSQFSFVRGGVVPAAPTGSAAWRTAVAVARVARANQWQSPAPGALYFHARHASPGWTRPVVARLGNHIFYR